MITKKNPLSLILAENLNFAKAAFTSMKLAYSNIEEIDPNKLDKSLSVAYILTSTEKSCFIGVGQVDKNYNEWKRGL